MKLSTLLAALITFCCSSAVAQEVLWQRQYGTRAYESPVDALATADGGYTILYTSVAESGDSAVVVRANLLRIDADGNRQWERPFGTSYSTQAGALFPYGNGGYIIIAAGQATLQSMGGPGYLSVFITDSSGVVISEIKQGESLGFTINGARRTTDGGFIVTGLTNESRQKVRLWKLGPDGRLQWEKTYAIGDLGLAFDVMQMDDGGYMITGAMSAGTHVIHKDNMLLRTDPDGDSLWLRRHSEPSWDEARSIFKQSDSTLLVVSSMDGVGTSLVVSLDGEVRVRDTFGIDPMVLTSTRQAPDGGFFVTGQKYATDSTISSHHLAYLARLDRWGMLEWENWYGPDSASFGGVVAIATESGVLLVGQLPHDILIMKISIPTVGVEGEFWRPRRIDLR